MDPDKTKAFRERKPPKNSKDVLSFLQTCSWYTRFKPNFADVLKPLSDLTKKNAIWKWNSDQQKSFDELKILNFTANITTNKCKFIFYNKN